MVLLMGFHTTTVLQCFAWAYFAMASLFILRTHIEGEENGLQWGPLRVLGLLSMLFWPLLFALVWLWAGIDRWFGAADRR